MANKRNIFIVRRWLIVFLFLTTVVHMWRSTCSQLIPYHQSYPLGLSHFVSSFNYCIIRMDSGLNKNKNIINKNKNHSHVRNLCECVLSEHVSVQCYFCFMAILYFYTIGKQIHLKKTHKHQHTLAHVLDPRRNFRKFNLHFDFQLFWKGNKNQKLQAVRDK